MSLGRPFEDGELIGKSALPDDLHPGLPPTTRTSGPKRGHTTPADQPLQDGAASVPGSPHGRSVRATGESRPAVGSGETPGRREAFRELRLGWRQTGSAVRAQQVSVCRPERCSRDDARGALRMSLHRTKRIRRVDGALTCRLPVHAISSRVASGLLRPPRAYWAGRRPWASPPTTRPGHRPGHRSQVTGHRSQGGCRRRGRLRQGRCSPGTGGMSPNTQISACHNSDTRLR